MPRPSIPIIATGTALPPHRLDADAVKLWARRVHGDPRVAERLIRLSGTTGIGERRLAVPVEEVVRPRSFAERNAVFERVSVELAEAAARRAFDRAQVAPDQIDHVITTSCTGILIPSLEALLAPRLGLRSDVGRLPITELGCAAGAAALRLAREHLLAFPEHRVLVIAVELTSLTYQAQDHSMTNVVASSLFGDGAAAVILGGRAPAPAPAIVDARTHLFPDTHHLMGFRIAEGGLHIVLDRDVPSYLDGRVRPLVEKLLADHRLGLGDLAFAAIHPGGRRILEDLERSLALPSGMIDASWHVLREHGNMSSATVLFVIDRLLRTPPPPPGSYGLLAAFGPGFSAELQLLRWPDGREVSP